MADVQTVLRGADIELADPDVPSVEEVRGHLLLELEHPYEIVDGYALVPMTPVDAHQAVQTEFGTEFSLWTRVHGGAVRFPQTAVRTARTRERLPDLLVVTAEHVHRLATPGLSGPPDVIVEILSPSTRKVDLGEKRAEYAGIGVGEYWCVDHVAGIIMVAAPPDAEWRIVRRGETLTSAALEGFSVELDAILPPVSHGG